MLKDSSAGITIVAPNLPGPWPLCTEILYYVTTTWGPSQAKSNWRSPMHPSSPPLSRQIAPPYPTPPLMPITPPKISVYLPPPPQNTSHPMALGSERLHFFSSIMILYVWIETEAEHSWPLNSLRSTLAQQYIRGSWISHIKNRHLESQIQSHFKLKSILYCILYIMRSSVRSKNIHKSQFNNIYLLG